jgi:hypothetical protein
MGSFFMPTVAVALIAVFVVAAHSTPSQVPGRNTTSSTTAISIGTPFKTVSDTDSFAGIDKTLNLDLRTLLKTTFERDNLNSSNVSIKSIQFKTICTSLCNDDNTEVLIKAAIPLRSIRRPQASYLDL